MASSVFRFSHTTVATFLKDFPFWFLFVCSTSEAGFRQRIEHRHHVDRSEHEVAESLLISVSVSRVFRGNVGLFVSFIPGYLLHFERSRKRNPSGACLLLLEDFTTPTYYSRRLDSLVFATIRTLD